MPSGSATRPGDVLHHRGGKTSEVLNTDAEGRLVLADALAYLSEKEPRAIVDTATLTGACMVALGEDLWACSGPTAGWSATSWPPAMPPASRGGALHRPYRKLIDSPIADVKNIGKRYEGAITAALFLADFVGDVPWAHVDIAGPAFAEKAGDLYPKGATGVPVRTLVAYLLGQAAKRRAPWRPSRTPARSSRSSHTQTTPRSARAARWRSGLRRDARSTCSSSRTATEARATPGATAPSSPRRVRPRPRRGRCARAHGCPYPGCARRRAREHHRDPRGGDPPDPDGAGRDRSLLRPDRVVLRGALLQPLGPPAGRRDRARRRVPRGGQPHYFAEQLSEGLDVREVRDVWLGWTNEPNHLEDVTGHFRTKMDALAAHASQVEDGIAFFKDELEREAAEAGAKIGVGHAEEFRVLALS